MESYVVAIIGGAIPVGAVYVGWLTKMVVDLAKTNAATVSKLEMVVVRQDTAEERIYAMATRG